ncbi:Gfo/Idh/MocA family protein [Kocuria palustris]|uniref:Gfo/Idh/MocA family protein n=1 Tax=Kocuria palustris TaxID=71999 RepID=UPI0023008F30|nr:Gfo/Idh/MocA family oxidoreductase [Kocuria palustris]
MTSRTLHLAVIGAGLIGRAHGVRALVNDRVGALTYVDPLLTEDMELPDELAGARRAGSLAEIAASVDGVIVATPNATHADIAVEAIAGGIPTLVEKPLASTEEDTLRIVRAADDSGVPVLVGHHRRHSGTLPAARAVDESGELGQLVAVSGSAEFSKPSWYFDEAPWRREPGGGPLLINLVHDLEALRHLAGEISRLRCVGSSAARGFPVEDTAALILEFASGALGTFLLSDAASSYRSWEQTSGENLSYDRATDEDCYHLAGRAGSLALPTMRRSRAEGEASWWSAARRDTVDIERIDPLTAQIDHFLDVIVGDAQPLVSARDGLQSLRLAASAAADGAPVEVAAPPA